MCNSKTDWLTDQKTLWWHVHFASGSNLLQIKFDHNLEQFWIKKNKKQNKLKVNNSKTYLKINSILASVLKIVCQWSFVNSIVVKVDFFTSNIGLRKSMYMQGNTVRPPSSRKQNNKLFLSASLLFTLGLSLPTSKLIVR